MPFQNQVLGTIVSSVLNYDQLCYSMGEAAGIDNTTSTYAPCDGRSIVGSRLEKLTAVGPTQPDPDGHIINAPDLRGRFIRGLNNFYSVGAPALDLQTADTEGQNRRVITYQGDMVGKHSHSIITADDGTPANSSYKITAYGKRQGTTLATEQNTGVETRPRNISVYFYIKIN